MSHIGKLTRGMKWYGFRNVDGNLPAEISEEPNKMKDVNYFLEHCKGKDIKKVSGALLKLRWVRKNNVEHKDNEILKLKAIIEAKVKETKPVEKK